MTVRFALVTVVAVLGVALSARADLKQVLAEPNLEKRSKLALDNASAALKRVREAYQKGDLDAVRADVAEALESVNITEKSLNETGKDPRRSPKWFKRAEMETRDLGRRIDSVQQEMSYTDRPLLDPLKTRTLQVHDALLVGLMEGKRK